VKIVEGVRAGQVCEVKCIYQGSLFLQSKDINKNQGICVEKADRCKVILDVFKKNNRNQSNNPPSFIPQPIRDTRDEQRGERSFVRDMQTPYVGASMKTGVYSREAFD
jgi:hypothetical protein